MSASMIRKGGPLEDDLEVRAIEVSFAIPVFIRQDQVRALHDLIVDIVCRDCNQAEGYSHWVSGVGSKIILQCRADQALLGKPIDPSLSRGSILSIDTSFM